MYAKLHRYAVVGTPTKSLIFDVLVHEEVYPGADPAMVIYDTALDGVADVNDQARDIDRLDLWESIQSLGNDVSRFRTTEVPRYAQMLRHVLGR